MYQHFQKLLCCGKIFLGRKYRKVQFHLCPNLYNSKYIFQKRSKTILPRKIIVARKVVEKFNFIFFRNLYNTQYMIQNSSKKVLPQKHVGMKKVIEKFDFTFLKLRSMPQSLHYVHTLN